MVVSVYFAESKNQNTNKARGLGVLIWPLHTPISEGHWPFAWAGISAKLPRHPPVAAGASGRAQSEDGPPSLPVRPGHHDAGGSPTASVVMSVVRFNLQTQAEAKVH